MGASILAIGVVSALGLDWETSCAAARCGISRAAALDHYRIQANDPWEVEFVVGHQADLLTRGFEGSARLLRLLAGAVKDLLRNTGASDAEPIPVYLSLPHPQRTLTNTALMLDDETRKEAIARRAEGPAEDTRYPEMLLTAGAALAGWSGARLAAVSRSGSTGTVEMLDRIVRDIGTGTVRRALLAVVDSLLDDETLAWLNATGRLKNRATAAGLIPGEGSVAMLLGAPTGGSASIELVAFDREDHPFEDGLASLGRGLSGVLRQFADRAGWPGDESPWVISDHNGEAYRAGDWGWALQRLTAVHIPIENSHVWYPAVSFGETGAAAPGLGAACALAAWRRGYAPAQRCAVLACSDDSCRGGFLMEANSRA